MASCPIIKKKYVVTSPKFLKFFRTYRKNRKIKGEKHGKPGQNIECINKVFKVRFENFFISPNAGTGERLPEKNQGRRSCGKK